MITQTSVVQAVSYCRGWGVYRDIKTGISLGCPLSPLIGAMCLAPLVERLGIQEVIYIRFVDDIIVLTKTRWQLRHAVRTTNQTLVELKLEKHQ